MPDSIIIVQLSRDVTVTLKAAKVPLSQFVTKMSVVESLSRLDPSHYQLQDVKVGESIEEHITYGITDASMWHHHLSCR